MSTPPKTKLLAFDLSDRVILITGGSGLLGVEHAKAIADAGGTPVIADLRVEAANGRLFYTSPPESYAFTWGNTARDLKIGDLDVHLPPHR